MKNYILLLLMGALMLTIMSCHDGDCPKAIGINGEWVWVKSIGGIGGSTLNPDSEGIEQSLFIDDFVYQKYIDDSLVFESAYDLEIRPDSSFGTNTFILFDTGGERAVEIKDSEFVEHELCFDCFSHYYKRK